jgi:hypothetical protein
MPPLLKQPASILLLSLSGCRCHGVTSPLGGLRFGCQNNAFHGKNITFSNAPAARPTGFVGVRNTILKPTYIRLVIVVPRICSHVVILSLRLQMYVDKFQLHGVCVCVWCVRWVLQIVHVCKGLNRDGFTVTTTTCLSRVVPLCHVLHTWPCARWRLSRQGGYHIIFFYLQPPSRRELGEQIRAAGWRMQDMSTSTHVGMLRLLLYSYHAYI